MYVITPLIRKKIWRSRESDTVKGSREEAEVKLELELEPSYVSKCQALFGTHFLLLCRSGEVIPSLSSKTYYTFMALACCWVGLGCPGFRPVLRETRALAKEGECPAPRELSPLGETCPVSTMYAPDKRLCRPEMAGKLPKRDGAEKWRFGQARGEGEGALKLLPRIFPSDSLRTRNLTFPILNSHNSPGERLLKKASSPATTDA